MNSRLAESPSSYLKSAAHQPVEWHPWGEAAFARAKEQQKPVLLDIGAVWCHWCHVMDGESYEDPDLARQLNRDWVCIKVDRDERPDVDARYQRAVQALTGQGGWPLTAFLTPDGDVFYGGTYFPPEDNHGRPSFTKVLTELSAAFRRHPDRVMAQAAEIRKHLAAHLAESRPGPVRAEDLDQAAELMARTFDFRNGGFGTAPKFPHPGACEFLLARWFDRREDWCAEAVHKTLSAMARGGVYDQIAGGFHRYSTDARWVVPHFEKMSYDNSELLRAYVHALAAATGSAKREAGNPTADYLRVINGIVDWVMTTMSNPAGGYYASQDADIGPQDDGDYFTWTPAEARAALSPDEFAVLERHYDIADAGEMHHHPEKNVLWIKDDIPAIATALSLSEPDVASRLASGRQKLKAARDTRQTPFVDTTIYTAWSAMMAGALLEAAALLDRPDVEHHALKTLERLFLEAAPDDGGAGAYHAIGGNVSGLLEDQVQLAHAAVDAYEATGGPPWLGRATRLMEHVWKHYRAEDNSLMDTVRGAGGVGYLDQPVVPVHDAPTPSPNGVAAIVLARLAEHTGDAKWATKRDQLLGALAGGAAELSLHGATLLRAMDWALQPAAHVVVVGRAADPDAAALRRAARVAYRPRKVITLLEPGMALSGGPSALRAALDGKAPRAYVCVGTQCAPPVERAADLATTISTFGTDR